MISKKNEGGRNACSQSGGLETGKKRREEGFVALKPRLGCASDTKWTKSFFFPP